MSKIKNIDEFIKKQLATSSIVVPKIDVHQYDDMSEEELESLWKSRERTDEEIAQDIANSGSRIPLYIDSPILKRAQELREQRKS